MIKTVIFDLGKVLIPFDFARGYRQLEKLCPHAAADIPKKLATTDLVHRFEMGLVEPRDFVAEISRILDLSITYEQFCDIWSSIFLPDTLIPDAILKGIAARYRMLVLSNTNVIHFDMVRQRYPMLRYFHDLVLSYEVKSMKPQPEIYQAAIDRAQCRPEECFYTDDIAAYVDAARNHGIDGVQFESSAKLERDLAARGIDWQ